MTEVEVYWNCRALLLQSESWSDPNSFNQLIRYIELCERWYPTLKKCKSKEEFEALDAEPPRTKPSRTIKAAASKQELPKQEPPKQEPLPKHEVKKPDDELPAEILDWVCRNVGLRLTEQDREAVAKKNRDGSIGLIVVNDEGMYPVESYGITPHGVYGVKITGDSYNRGKPNNIKGELHAIRPQYFTSETISSRVELSRISMFQVHYWISEKR